MAVTLAISLQKGGTSKTTTTETLSAILGSRGYRVLLVDMDSQANCTFISGVDPDKTITDVFTGSAGITEAIYPSAHYDILPADDYLANVERLPNLEPTLLKDCLAAVQDRYDFIFVDTPPALGSLLQCSLMASDYVLIPIDPRPLAIKGLDAFVPTLEAVKEASGHLKLLGIVLVRYNDRTVLNRQIRGLLEERADELGTVLFRSKIRESISVPEAQTIQKSLIDYAPKSNPCVDYQQLADEILKILNKR